jgi:ribbon-helix-helix protein, copG family
MKLQKPIKENEFTMITFRIQKNVIEKLNFIAKKNNLTKTEVLRQLIGNQYNEETNNKKSEE